MKYQLIIFLCCFLPLAVFSQHTISGQVVLPNALPVCDVLVELKTANGDLLDQEITGTDGTFAFENQAAAEGYQLYFSKEDIAHNGVSTLDLVLTSRIILGIITPQNNYDYWPSDVNDSNTITTLDLVWMKRIILGIDTSFPTASWAFDEYTAFFPDDVIDIVNLSENIDLDVTAVKRGDLNQTVAVCE